MELVVDANIVFSAIISDGFTRKLVLDDDFLLFAPRFLVNEMSDYEQLLLDKAEVSEEEFDKILRIVKGRIEFIGGENFSDVIEWTKSFSPDPKDADYLALALKLNCPLWSNDARLKAQRVVRVLSTRELANL